MTKTPPDEFCGNCKKLVVPKTKSHHKVVYVLGDTAYCTFECYNRVYKDFVKNPKPKQKKKK